MGTEMKNKKKKKRKRKETEAKRQTVKVSFDIAISPDEIASDLNMGIIRRN